MANAKILCRDDPLGHTQSCLSAQDKTLSSATLVKGPFRLNERHLLSGHGQEDFRC